MTHHCSDCSHSPSSHFGGRCNVLVTVGAMEMKPCNCSRIFADEDSLGVSRDDLPPGFDWPALRRLRKGRVQESLPLRPRPHKRVGLIPVTVEDSGILLGYLRGDDVIETQGPCSILPANHPALTP